MRFCVLASVLFSALIAASGASATVCATWYQYSKTGYTADGTRFDPDDPTTVANRRLPFGTQVRFINLENGRMLDAVVRDRGPFKNKRSRKYDLTRAGAQQLGFADEGVDCKLKVEVMTNS